MIIKLREIPVIYICPDHNDNYHKRKLHMDKLLNKLEFKNIIHYKSGTEKYPYCLNNATIELFSKYKAPFLLLEDDIEVTHTIPEILEIPDNTDAFYLGLSSGGGHIQNNYDDGDSKFEYVNNNLYKVKNMLSAHAVLYITPKYILTVRNMLITKPEYYNDVIISQIQNKFNIYCHNESYFYQSIHYDGHENATKIKLNKPNSLIFVTAFININNTPLDIVEKNYFSYFEKLAQTGVNIALFLDTQYQEYGKIIIRKYSNVTIIRYLTKDELHINKIKIPNQLPKIRNIQKDNEDYLKLMNNKIYFVQEAMNKYTETNYFSWIDFRIFHIFSNDNEKLISLSNLAYFSKPLYFPGALDNKKYLLDEINWRFLGGFFIINKNIINNLVDETTKLLNNIPILTWEVNIWAILESNNLFDFGWYKADHNQTIIL